MKEEISEILKNKYEKTKIKEEKTYENQYIKNTNTEIELPEELMKNIFSYIKYKEIILNIQYVSKGWKSIIYDDEIWKDKYLKKFQTKNLLKLEEENVYYKSYKNQIENEKNWFQSKGKEVIIEKYDKKETIRNIGISAIEVSPNNQYLYVGDVYGKLKIYDIKTKNNIKEKEIFKGEKIEYIKIYKNMIIIIGPKLKIYNEGFLKIKSYDVKYNNGWITKEYFIASTGTSLDVYFLKNFKLFSKIIIKDINNNQFNSSIIMVDVFDDILVVILFYSIKVYNLKYGFFFFF
jgi:WD40 repeat protein